MLPTVFIMLISVLFCYSLLKASRSKQNIVLSVFIISFFLNLLFATLGAAQRDPATALFYVRLSNITIPTIFGAGFHFLAVYPRRKWIFNKWSGSWLLCYLPFAPLWYTFIDTRLGIISVKITETGVNSVRHPFQLIFTVLGLIIGIVVLVIDYRLAAKHKAKATNTIEYGMYRTVSLGLASLVGGSLMGYLLMILFRITMAFIIPFSFFAMLLFFSFSLLRYQLSNLRGRAVELTAGFSAMIVLASAGMMIIVNAHRVSAVDDIILFIVGLSTTGALILFFYPLREALTRFLEWLAPEFESGRGKEYELDEIYLINCIDGLVMYHYATLVEADPNDAHSKAEKTEEEAGVNVVGGMLTAVVEFCKESLNIEDRDYLRVLRFGSKKIMIEHGEDVYSVVVGTGEDNGEVSNLLQETLGRLQNQHRRQLEAWDGDMGSLPDFTPYFAPLISYSGTGADQ